MRTALVTAVVATALLLAAGWHFWRVYERFLATPLTSDSAGAVLVVEPGMSGRAVVARLADMGLTRAGWPWRVLLRRESAVIQAGEYRVEPGMRPRELLIRLARGDVIRYRFTIVEGWTLRQLLDALARDERLGASMPPADDPSLLDGLAPGYPNKEGWFLPETYVYVRGDDYLGVLRRAYEAMRTTLAEAWDARAAEHPATGPYDLLILASIVEKETARADERREIAGVFVRRLRRGMRLQTDPTVIYGLGESFDGDIRRRDLDTDTPYNTYTRGGLPPTPIALPSRDALFAAAQPAAGDALYFVADGSGGHTFSATLEQHQQAVEHMLERQP